MQLPVIGAVLFFAVATGCQSADSRTAPVEKSPSSTGTAPAIASAASAPAVQRARTADPNPTTDKAVLRQAPDEPKAVTKKHYVVAALGDSLTDARSGGGYLKVLASHCPESRFINFGKGADMTNQMRRRYEAEIVPQIDALGLTTLLVYGGVNDLYSDLTAHRKNDRIEEDLSAIYSSAKENGLEIVAITVSPWGSFSRYYNERRGENTRLLNSWILGQVSSGKITHAVDSYPLLSCGNPEVLCPEYETRHHDGIHLGPQGHTLLGEKIASTAFADCL